MISLLVKALQNAKKSSECLEVRTNLVGAPFVMITIVRKVRI